MLRWLRLRLTNQRHTVTEIQLASPIHHMTAKSIDGVEIDFSQFDLSVLLIVNVASQCAFTGQYADLQSLYETYRERGLVVLGFPCNQFGGQESNSEEKIKEFCTLTYNVTFPMFSKIEVNGAKAHPLYRYLKSNARGLLGTESIKWNFTKFLVGRNGLASRRFSPTSSRKILSRAIERLL